MILKYINSANEEIDFLSDSIRVREANFSGYEWEYDSTEKQYGISIDRFKKKEKRYDLSVAFKGTDAERKENLDRFMRITEYDVVTGKSGKLIHGNEYINCFVVLSSTYPGETYSFCSRDITALVPYPFWIREYPYFFKKSDAKSSNNKRYAYRYAYRYANGLMNTAIVNDHYADCNFKLVIYGPITDPLVYIGGHEYLVNIILQEGEYLEIDSAAETVTKVTVFGDRVNAFNNRNFAISVFEPIHPGRQNVGWSGRFDFDLILYEERSEPKWQ